MIHFKPFSYLSLLAVILLCVSCGPDKDKARFQGKLTNISEAEFYAYTDDGTISGIDTIRISDGEFTYERQLTRPMLLTLLYPNFTQTYVVLEPGKTVKLKGDASKIGEASIGGTEENELLSEFRQSHASGPERNVRLAAADFIRTHAATLAAVAVFKKYFEQSASTDARTALSLLGELHKAQPASPSVQHLWTTCRPQLESGVGQPLPDLAAQTLDGRTVRLADYRGRRLLIVLYATWRGPSLSFLREVKRLLREPGMNEWACVAVSADYDVKACREAQRRDTIAWPVVCDGLSFRSPFISRLALSRVPSCLLVNAQGRVVARDISDISELRQKMRQ